MPTATTSQADEAAYRAWVAEMAAEGIALDAYDLSLARQRFTERAERGLLARSGVTMLASSRTRRGDLDERREGVQRTADDYWKQREAERAEAEEKRRPGR